MSKKFTLLLMGPAGTGKSAFIAGFSKLDIFPYITARKQGGANTTKVATTYEFTNKHNEFRITSCEAAKFVDSNDLLVSLQQLINEDNGIQKIFEKINDADFAKKCKGLTIELPYKDQFIPKNTLYDTIVVRDSRGFGDVDDEKGIVTDDLGVTEGVNAIIFTANSSEELPTVFSKIVNEVMAHNLKTPIFLLRRDPDKTYNDKAFEDTILLNIKNADQQLSDAITSMDTSNLIHDINRFVFNVPVVKEWKGVLDEIPKEQTEKEIAIHSEAMKEVLHYAIRIYENLYNVLVDKLQGEYQDRFKTEVLDKLISSTAFDVAAKITRNPTVIPGNGTISRDTDALAYPVETYKTIISEIPFQSEIRSAGNAHQPATIPSYSYSCVNFRNIFRSIVYRLRTDYKLSPLFSTFMDIVLKDATVEVRTGYLKQDCLRDAFKFNIIVHARTECTAVLKNNNITIGESWKSFNYTPFEKQYEGSEAIAVLMYKYIILSLNLTEAYNEKKQDLLREPSENFVKKFKGNEIEKKCSVHKTLQKGLSYKSLLK